jgi:peptide/nickel transport system ATP-binding protein
MADRIAVLYLGRILELGSAEAVFSGPHHPYTESLLSAVPSSDLAPQAHVKLSGEIPSPSESPSGCVFHSRCPRSLGERCEREEPPLVDIGDNHLMRCHLPPNELGRAEPVVTYLPSARRPVPTPG